MSLARTEAVRSAIPSSIRAGVSSRRSGTATRPSQRIDDSLGDRGLKGRNHSSSVDERLALELGTAIGQLQSGIAVMKISSGLAFALVVVCASAGCVSEINSCATWVHQSWTTDKAWRCRKWMYEGIDCGSSFKAGFKAGYRFANCGGDSCQPPGPSHFWCTGGMTEEDQRKAQAWCDGFTHGTLAAQQDGNTKASALDAQSAQPPENTPEVYYYSTPGSIGEIGWNQSRRDPFAVKSVGNRGLFVAASHHGGATLSPIENAPPERHRPIGRRRRLPRTLPIRQRLLPPKRWSFRWVRRERRPDVTRIRPLFQASAACVRWSVRTRRTE